MSKSLPTISWLVILFNLPLVFLNIKIVLEDGGPMGWGWLVFPFLVLVNLFLIPATLALFLKDTSNKSILLFLNILGLSVSFITCLVIVF